MEKPGMSQIFPEIEDISKTQVSQSSIWPTSTSRGQRIERFSWIVDSALYSSLKLIYMSQIYFSSRGSGERYQGIGKHKQICKSNL